MEERGTVVVIIAGQPGWAEAAAAALGDTAQVQPQSTPSGYMNALIERRAALVLVDGDAPGWEQWVTPPKVSPATRRIPIVVLSASADERARASLKGADLALAPAEALAELPRLLRDMARVPDAALLEALDCACQEPLPPLAIEGVAKFNAGEYYAQHDLFEEQWVNTSGPVRDLYRAILQVGVAYYQIERGNYRGALKMLQRSVQWLLLLPDVCQGVNIARLRADSFRVRAELERLGEARFHEFDRSLIRGLERVDPMNGPQ